MLREGSKKERWEKLKKKKKKKKACENSRTNTVRPYGLLLLTNQAVRPYETPVRNCLSVI